MTSFGLGRCDIVTNQK